MYHIDLDDLKRLGLILNKDKLKQIHRQYYSQLCMGLKKKDGQIAMLPSYLPPPFNIKPGQICSLDVGGTHIRSAIVNIE